MGRTQFASENYGDGLTKRPDVNINEAGSALIRKILAGAGINITFTGVDSGTGDVTIIATGAAGAQGSIDKIDVAESVSVLAKKQNVIYGSMENSGILTITGKQVIFG